MRKNICRYYVKHGSEPVSVQVGKNSETRNGGDKKFHRPCRGRRLSRLLTVILENRTIFSIAFRQQHTCSATPCREPPQSITPI